VADSFDAMTSFRVYRTSLSMAEALGEVKKKAGIYFDPEIVEAFEFVLSKESFYGRKEKKEGRAMGVMDIDNIDIDEAINLIRQWSEAKELEKIFALLKDSREPAVREAASLQLIRCGGLEVAKNFVSLLSSPEAHLRSIAVEALQEIGSSHLELLEELLWGQDDDLKILCFSVLSGIKGKEAAFVVRRYFQNLLETGKEETENVLAAGIECLGELGEEKDLKLLKECERLLAEKNAGSFLYFSFKEAEEKICLNSS